MKILIIEDEPQTASVLKDIIQEVRPQSEILETLESIGLSVKYLSDAKNQPDLIFMDIQLSDGLSFEIFPKLPLNVRSFSAQLTTNIPFRLLKPMELTTF